MEKFTTQFLSFFFFPTKIWNLKLSSPPVLILEGKFRLNLFCEKYNLIWGMESGSNLATFNADTEESYLNTGKQDRWRKYKIHFILPKQRNYVMVIARTLIQLSLNWSIIGCIAWASYLQYFLKRNQSL